ncbi:PREDICTED: CDT1-like protein a, chloroplastic [Nicotiana attenuata]|uniref:Cdt1-like protein a, chloroplastic n=1 Tax=Nicotiana attenuata TaxID=49451 RepID=A0A1J6KAJ8_NICAT|nr:PREDICTED: CDT1-like protein a, chloroplastic [Nicotiana attenuata]OIT22000.1 cdt1-like protein a, chloroplastic [Nicotiana attenuata]
MESSQSSYLSKKQLFPTSKLSLSKQSDPNSAGAPCQDAWNTKTPEKPIDHTRRTRNRNAAFSLKQVRQAAQKFCKSDLNHPTPQPDRLLSSGKSHGVSSFSGSSKAKSKKPIHPVKLPEKYELLYTFFSSLDSLLQFKSSSTTFTNISSKIEWLTDRRFSYAHLAQLKFILPEVIEIKKILVRDERSYCMKPELHIVLNANAVEIDEKLKSSSSSDQLRKVFRTRLLNFLKSHPQGEDVPEEELPGPFSESRHEVLTNSSGSAGSQLISETPIGSVSEQRASASHLSQSFKRRFSCRVSIGEPENAKQHPPVTECQIAKSSNNKRTSTASDKCPSKMPTTQTSTVKNSSEVVAFDTLLLSPLPVTPMKNIKGDDGYALLTAEGTQARLTSTPEKLMTSTPMPQSPKRCCMSLNSDSTESPSKLVRRPPRNRCLNFNTPVKSSKATDKACEGAGLPINSDIIDIFPEDLLQSILQKERKKLEEQDPALSQAKWCKQMISSLPKFFDMIYFLFQSGRRMMITKEELIHKVISSHLEIADRREVEEQLRLLQELAPEWIYKKVAASGDLLLCVNKISSLKELRTRLAEAKLEKQEDSCI